VLAHWFNRQLEDVFFTFYEGIIAIGLRSMAPFLAIILLIAGIGIVLLCVLDAFAFAARAVSIIPVYQAPRSLATAAILSGYFLWGRLASPERIEAMEVSNSLVPPNERYQRRLKVAALVAVFVLVYVIFSEA
jgi:hypothetical protein